MESPGEHLKREREHRGVSLLKIFETTRVPMKYLEAIEADRIEGFPHPTFVKGYIRSYCKVLGLDENDAVLRFEVWFAEKTAETQEAGKPKPIQELKRERASQPAKPRREIKIPANAGKAAVIAAGIIVIIVAYALTKRDISAPEPALTPATAPIQAAAEPSPSIEPLAPEPIAAALAPEAASSAKAPQPIAQSAPQALPSPAPVAVKTQPQQPMVKPVQQTEPAKVEKALQPEPVKKEAPANGAINEIKNHTLTASAREMVWLKVGIDKSEPIEVLLKQGERVTWTATDNINIVIGNAGGVSLTYNGKAMPGLGSTGEVVDLRLPSGKSYKIKKPVPAAEAKPFEPQSVEPEMQPAVNMPEVPAAKPQVQPEG